MNYHLSKLEYYTDLWIYPPLVVALFIYDYDKISVTLLFIGYVIWSLLEYLIHRFILHGNSYFKPQHIQHHIYPTAYIGTSLCQTLSIIFVLIFITWWFNVIDIMIGSLFGYCLYIIVHDAIHHDRVTSIRGLKLHHLKHHNNIRKNYGVTTPLWDFVFRTYT